MMYCDCDECLPVLKRTMRQVWDVTILDDGRVKVTKDIAEVMIGDEVIVCATCGYVPPNLPDDYEVEWDL